MLDGNMLEGKGTNTNKLERHIKPIKLLLWAIRADSLIDIEARPLLCITGCELISRVKSRICPRSLQSNTGSLKLSQISEMLFGTLKDL